MLFHVRGGGGGQTVQRLRRRRHSAFGRVRRCRVSLSIFVFLRRRARQCVTAQGLLINGVKLGGIAVIKERASMQFSILPDFTRAGGVTEGGSES